MKFGLASSAPLAPVMSAGVDHHRAGAAVEGDHAAGRGTAAATNAVVASCEVEVPAPAVGAAGTPVKVGLASIAPPTADTSAASSTTAPVRQLKRGDAAGR